MKKYRFITERYETRAYMLNRLSVFGVLMLILGCLSLEAADTWDPFLGVWEYRQRNSEAETGFDREGEQLKFRREGKKVVGEYFGLERMGDENRRER
jgi:hypothetical protein